MKIDGWSFILHPEVFSLLQRGGDPLVRYILFIETLRAKFYFVIREFLQGQTVNVNSYFTGGSADFICDIYATETAYKNFYKELAKILVTAGAGSIKEVKNLIAVFRVEEPVVLCRQVIADLGKVDSTGIKLIMDDVAKFELVYRDYMSAEVKQAFPGYRGLPRYLSDLRRSKAIIGFRALFDNCRLTDREYVPLCHGRALDTLMRQAGEPAKAVLGPVLELLRVIPEHSTDDAEREVSHIFINEYDSPGERNDWRIAVYKQLGDELNVFTFPLEGTLNETPIVFSDLPEAIMVASEYQGDIPLGRLSHDSRPQDAHAISIQSESLATQGVTLGKPGQGKTNTDCVLLTGVSRYFKRIIVIDHSRSIKEKEAKFSEDLRKRIRYVSPGKGTSLSEIAASVAKCVEDYLYVVEVSADQLPILFDACLSEIDKSTENEGNARRVVNSFLLVEEANDALGRGDERKRIVDRLEDILAKAYRKGWCVWLSTQKPSHLGYDDDSSIRILRLLKYRILHAVEPVDAALLKTATANGPLGKRLDETVSLATGEAIVFGHFYSDDKMVSLPPVRVRVNELGADAATALSKRKRP
jgi:hypothetical protein